MMKNKKDRQKGLSLIDVLVGTFLILIIFVGIFGAFRLGFKAVYQAESKITATAIANQRIEMARNLSYDSVGTQGASLPYADGLFEPSEVVTQNNIDYTMETEVKYIVDEADGLASPDDPCPNDYKRMRVTVSWGGIFASEISLSADVFPENLSEECSETGGILSISVFNAFGTMVSSPLIEVFDSVSGERVDFATPSEGSYYFPLEPNTYKVVVSKSGYSQERTYGSDEIASPEKSHPIVIEGEVTEMSFSIDQLSSFSVRTVSIVDEEVVAAPNITFNLKGAKLIGYDDNEDPVFKYSQDLTTDSQGELNIDNLEWDSYTFSIDPATGLDLVDTDPSPQPIDLLPNNSVHVDLYVDSENSLLLTILDNDTLEPVFSATVHLFNTSSGYDETLYTDENGRAYFIPLEPANYDLEIVASGYSSYSGLLSVVGDTVETINLIRVE